MTTSIEPRREDDSDDEWMDNVKKDGFKRGTGGRRRKTNAGSLWKM